MACGSEWSATECTPSEIGVTNSSIIETPAAESGGDPDEFDFVENPPEDLHCSICLSVLRNPNLTSCCGNHFCQECIERIQSDGKPCPLCQRHDYSIMLDKSILRRVRQLRVRCRNMERGCKWVGELGDARKHLDSTCDFVDVTCSLLCGAEVPRYHLPDHKANTCPNRPYTCPYCDLQATYVVITEDHWLQCESYPVECRNGCGVGPIERKDLPTHFSECPLEVIECEFSAAGCGVSALRKEMPLHLEKSVSSHVGLIPTICSRFEEKLEMKDKAMTELLSKFEEKLEQKDEAAVKLCRGFELALKENEKKMNDLQAIVGSQQSEIEKLTAKLHDTSSIVHLHSLPPVEFVMTDYESHYYQEDQWFSPPFHSHEKGYKMCLSVYAYGIGHAFGKYVSVFANLMKGEFDDMLAWPFRGNVEVDVLVDGDEDRSYSHTFKFTDRSPSKAADRVVYGDRNTFGQGRANCISLNDLVEHPDFLKFRIHCVLI